MLPGSDEGFYLYLRQAAGTLRDVNRSHANASQRRGLIGSHRFDSRSLQGDVSDRCDRLTPAFAHGYIPLKSSWGGHVAQTCVLRTRLHCHRSARRQPDRNGRRVAQRLLFATATTTSAGSGVVDSRDRGGLLRKLRIHSQARNSQARQEIPETRLLRSSRWRGQRSLSLAVPSCQHWRFSAQGANEDG